MLTMCESVRVILPSSTLPLSSQRPRHISAEVAGSSSTSVPPSSARLQALQYRSNFKLSMTHPTLSTLTFHFITEKCSLTFLRFGPCLCRWGPFLPAP